MRFVFKRLSVEKSFEGSSLASFATWSNDDDDDDDDDDG
jgi:hypothetical protein